jgi:tripartite-type tricarboxylate transporter receptor subunit TctC
MARPLRFWAACTLLLAAQFAGFGAQAQDTAGYPARPVKIIVPFAPAGPTDTMARLIAQKLSDSLGKQFYIENHPGAGGNLGMAMVANAAPDGYTLLLVSSSVVVNPSLYEKVPYDVYKSLAPVTLAGSSPNILVVHPSVPAKNVKELIAYVQANPGKVSFASQGIGTASHLTGAMLMKLTGTSMVHVPYKGTAPILTDIIAGHVDLTFIQVSSASVMHEAGKARILALATDHRLDFLPDIPTLAEIRLPISTDTWNAISAPPKTPAAIIAKLNTAVNAALRQPDVRQRLSDLKTVIGGDNGPADAARFVETERRQWGELVRAAGLEPQ